MTRNANRLTQKGPLIQSLDGGSRALAFVVSLVVAASAQAPITTSTVGPGASATSSCPTLSPPVVATSIPKYWPLPNQVVSTADKRCSDGKCSLQGWLYRPATPPAGSSTFPAVVHMHGHGQSPGEACQMISDYTSRGYIVFAPVLRGARDKNNKFSNTGLYIDDYLATINPSSASDSIDYLHQEIAEVRAALTYLTTFSIGGVKPVDPARIALTGHSFGGSLVVFAAAANLSPRPAATVDLSGAVLSWGGSTAWKTAYQAEAALHQMPIRFQQTSNETSAAIKTDPTTVPFLAANGSGTGEAEMAVYSAVPGVATIHDAHVEFLMSTIQVERWMPAVVAFIQSHGVR
jgi:dienelactone hydrolase